MAKLFSYLIDVPEPYVDYPVTTVTGDPSAVEFIAEWNNRAYYMSPDSFNTDTHDMDPSLDYQYHASIDGDLACTLVYLAGKDVDNEEDYTSLGLTYTADATNLADNDPAEEPVPGLNEE